MATCDGHDRNAEKEEEYHVDEGGKAYSSIQEVGVHCASHAWAVHLLVHSFFPKPHGRDVPCHGPCKKTRGESGEEMSVYTGR